MSPEARVTHAGLRAVLSHLLASFRIVAGYPVILPAAVLMLVNEANYSGINNVAIAAFLNGLPPAMAPGVPREYLIGAVASTFLLAETLFRLPGGWLSDRYGRARVITLAILLAAPSFLLSALAPHVAWFFPLRAWEGMMAAVIFTAIYAIIGDAVPERFRANAMGVINAMYMLGLLAGYAVAGAVDTLTGHPRYFYFLSAGVAGVAGLFALVIFRARPDLNAPHPEVHLEEAGKAAVSASRHAVLLTITFLQNLALTVLAPYMYVYAVKRSPAEGGLGLSLGELGVLVGGPLLGIAFCAIPLSRLADRIGKVTAVRIAFTLVAATLWLFAVTHLFWLLALAATLVGIGFSMGVPAWLAIISSLSCSKSRGAMLGGYGTVQGLAAVVGPLLGALIAGLFGLPRIFVFSALLVAIAALLSWTALREQKCHPDEIVGV